MWKGRDYGRIADFGREGKRQGRQAAVVGKISSAGQRKGTREMRLRQSLHA